MKKLEPLLATPYFVNFKEYAFAHKQDLDLNGLIGRAMSSSYLPREGKEREELVSDLQDLFNNFSQQKGYVSLAYSTSVHIVQVVKN
ncbi:MAG: hypothetical protein AAFX80_19145 [Cyanobacteria bacterium J06639_18]